MNIAITEIAAAAALVCVVACSDTTASSQDEPGMATVSLVSNGNNDGAISVTVHGPGLSTATALDSAHTVFTRFVSSTELRVIVIGNTIPPGPLFALPVGASNRPSAYTVTIEQVAGLTDSLKTDLSSYAASLTPPLN